MLERICVRDFVVATDFSVLDPMSHYLGSLLRQLLSLNKLKMMILSSFQNDPGSTPICARLRLQIALWPITCKRVLFSKTAKRASQAGVCSRVTAISDSDLLVVEVESGVCVQGVRVVRGRVHSSKRWMQIAATIDDPFF